MGWKGCHHPYGGVAQFHLGEVHVGLLYRPPGQDFQIDAGVAVPVIDAWRIDNIDEVPLIGAAFEFTQAKSNGFEPGTIVLRELHLQMASIRSHAASKFDAHAATGKNGGWVASAAGFKFGKSDHRTFVEFGQIDDSINHDAWLEHFFCQVFVGIG